MKKALLLLCKIAFAAFALVALVVLLVDRNVNYFQSFNNMPFASNIALLAVMALVVALAAILLKSRPRHRTTDGTSLQSFLQQHYTAVCIGVAAFVFIFNTLAYASIQLVTGWDVGVLTDAAVTPIEDWNDFLIQYFSAYPNNTFMLWVLRVINSVSSGFLGPNEYHTVFAVCSIICVTLSVYLFMRTARKLMASMGWALAASALFVLLIGLSPWALIPYSDSFGLVFCTAILWCFVCGEGRFAKWVLPSLLTGVGLSIKPTIIFAFVAGCVSVVMSGVAKKSGRQMGYAILCVVFGLVVGIVGARQCSASLGLALDADAEMPMSHYVMMGLNDTSDGGYDGDDVEFSQSQPNVQTRTEANWNVVSKRIAEYGPLGLAGHTLKKLLYIYNDGTFCWGAEGARSSYRTQVADFPLAPYVESYYLGEGMLNKLFCTLQQSLWLIVLIGIPLGFFGLRRIEDDERSDALSIVAVLLASIFALTLFLLVFEARSRYLYLYGSYFVLLAAWGYKQLVQWIGKRRSLPQYEEEPSR